MVLRFDRDRVRAFACFLWQRFVDDKCLETAGALSYTTLFALVPVTAAVFGILAALPVFSGWSDALSDFLFRNFVPAAGHAVQHYLLKFAGNASKLTGIGIVVLLVSALMIMFSIEERFNRIWRVPGKRSPVSRFLMYWAALTLGPILLVAGLTVTSYLAALPLLGRAGDQIDVGGHILGMLPWVVTFIALFSMYRVIPDRPVPWRHAAIGALLATLLFEFARWAFATYVRSVPSYQEIYGALAVVPIFLVWIYLSWVIVLLGASIAASLTAFEYRPSADRLPPGAEFLGLMHLLKHFAAAQRGGRALGEAELRTCERFVSDDLLKRYLDDMQDAELIQRTEGGDAWVMTHSLDTATLTELYEAGHYRLPLDAQALDGLCAGLPVALRTLLADLATHLRSSLDTRLSDVFFPLARADAPPTDPRPEQESSG
ncbi:MAG TPA: YihY family inner membrane protein [Rhodanobacteraceae bacterium]|jgi:membrane protein|nr:YihY family inner membrane protein [Rhodanobacteraceae bacterium]